MDLAMKTPDLHREYRAVSAHRGWVAHEVARTLTDPSARSPNRLFNKIRLGMKWMMDEDEENLQDEENEEDEENEKEEEEEKNEKEDAEEKEKKKKKKTKKKKKQAKTKTNNRTKTRRKSKMAKKEHK